MSVRAQKPGFPLGLGIPALPRTEEGQGCKSDVSLLKTNGISCSLISSLPLRADQQRGLEAVASQQKSESEKFPVLHFPSLIVFLNPAGLKQSHPDEN